MFARKKEIAREIMRSYNAGLPFDPYIRKYFRSHRNFGSRDRRFYRDYCYAYLRTGQWRKGNDLKWELGAWLLKLDLLYPGAFDFSEFEALALAEDGDMIRWHSAQRLYPDLKLSQIFPAFEQWSTQLKDHNPTWLFQLPKLWFRTLNNAIAPVGSQAGPIKNSFALPLSTDLASLMSPTSFEVQDIASQMASNFIPVQKGALIWDCCAGSGGKSLFVADHYEAHQIFTSDVRESILENLKKRFQSRSVRPKVFVADPSLPGFKLPPHLPSKFDHIIADVPCSGSGTWRRNPESLCFFDSTKLKEYQQLQRAIVLGAAKYLQSNGIIQYITCSVYETENEENLQWFEAELGLHVVKQTYLDQRDIGGDVLFVAELRNR